MPRSSQSSIYLGGLPVFLAVVKVSHVGLQATVRFQNISCLVDNISRKSKITFSQLPPDIARDVAATIL